MLWRAALTISRSGGVWQPGSVRLIDFSTLIAGKRPRSAMARSMTMWPSRMPRTASAIGSLWSSPSTSTVKMAVIGPAVGRSGGVGPRRGRPPHGALQPLLAEGLLDEFTHLAAPLADQADDHRAALGVLGQHRQQHRLADAGAGEDAQPLAAAAGGEDVHRPHAEVEPFADPVAGVRRRRRAAQ